MRPENFQEFQQTNVEIFSLQNEGNETFNSSLVDKGFSRRDLLIGAGLGAAVIVGAGAFLNRFTDFFNLPKVEVDLGDLGSEPPVIEAEIKPESYTYEVSPGSFEMVTNSKVGVAVAVTGHKDGALWGLFGVTDAHYDKILYGDFLPSTDQAQFNNSLNVRKFNGEISSVSATLNAMDVFQPRIDFSDFRNQININTDDSQEEIDKKIAEFKEDGSHYDKTGGFDCTACSVSSAELINGANIIAQYAITIDGAQPDIIADATNKYAENMKEQLATRYGIQKQLVYIDINYSDGTDPENPPSPEHTAQIYNQRIKDAYEEAMQENGYSLFNVAPELRKDDEGENYVYAKLVGGAELKVVLSGITYSPEIRAMILQNIQDSSGGTSLESNNLSVTSDNNLVYDQPPAPSLPVYDQPPAPSLPVYDQPPAPSLPVYDQPPAPTANSEVLGPPYPVQNDD